MLHPVNAIQDVQQVLPYPHVVADVVKRLQRAATAVVVHLHQAAVIVVVVLLFRQVATAVAVRRRYRAVAAATLVADQLKADADRQLAMLRRP